MEKELPYGISGIIDDVEKCNVSASTKYQRCTSTRTHTHTDKPVESSTKLNSDQTTDLRFTRVVLGARGNVVVMGC